jgi:hypothetical protein
MWGWVGPRTGLDDVQMRKFLPSPGLELRPLGHPARRQSLYRIRYSGSLGKELWIPWNKGNFFNSWELGRPNFSTELPLNGFKFYNSQPLINRAVADVLILSIPMFQEKCISVLSVCKHNLLLTFNFFFVFLHLTIRPITVSVSECPSLSWSSKIPLSLLVCAVESLLEFMRAAFYPDVATHWFLLNFLVLNFKYLDLIPGYLNWIHLKIALFCNVAQ